MDNMGSKFLEALQILLVVLGILAALWGVYDMFGDGQQSSMGLKKIIGGVAFAVISGFSMQWGIGKIKEVETMQVPVDPSQGITLQAPAIDPIEMADIILVDGIQIDMANELEVV